MACVLLTVEPMYPHVPSFLRLPHTLLQAAFLLTAPIIAQATIIINGDFETGNTGFGSTYSFVSPGGNSLTPAGVYTVDDNPQNSHSGFYSMGDHTTGSGLMMIVNGSPTTGFSVWSGTVGIDLVVGELYDFSAWVASVHPMSPAILTFSVGSLELGTLSPLDDGTWSRLFTPFTATELRPTFHLINSNGAFGGNDFAIDDIDIFYAGTTTNPGGNQVPDAGPGMLGLAALAGLLAVRARRL